MPSPHEISQSLAAILIFLLAAHLGGFLFQRFRQPVVIGEIVGGLLLGPSVLGLFWPDLYQQLFVTPERARLSLSLIYNFGLLLLMFVSGLEADNLFSKGSRRTAWILAVLGTMLPLAFGYAIATQMDLSRFIGSHGDVKSLAIVLGCATAVTSLPVISRIFMDMGILKSAFARLVLSASLVDDVILYLILALVLSMSTLNQEADFGLLAPLLESLPYTTHVLLSSLLHVAFVIASISLGRPIIQKLAIGPIRFLMVRQPVSAYIVIMISFVIAGYALSIPFVLSAFCGGIATSQCREFRQADHEALKSFSMAFFFPIYFAYVGFRINLAQDFDVAFTVGLIVIASVIKTISMWVSSRLAGLPKSTCLDLSITMNARGGPGIVLASVAYDAQLITTQMFVSLVLLAIVTSMGAGSWLQWRLDRKKLNHELE